MKIVIIVFLKIICPGISFGSNGEGYVRFSYPTDLNNIKIALDRLKAFINENYV